MGLLLLPSSTRFSPVNHVMEDQCFIESIPPLGTAIGVFNNLAEYDVACFDA